MQPGYRETLLLPWWAALLLALTLALCAAAFLGFRGAVAADSPGLHLTWDAAFSVILLVTLSVPALLGRLEIAVEGNWIRIQFGFVPVIQKKIPLALIAKAEAVTYKPIRQFGGWGIRWGKHAGAETAVYSMKGATGVLLTLTEPIETLFLRTDKILIGSRDPARLADHLNGVAC